MRGTLRHKIMLVTFTIMMVTAGGFFVLKLVELGMLVNSGDDGSFALQPLVVYLCVAAGFFSLFVWATLNGQFKDIEGPKDRLLSREREIDLSSGDGYTGEISWKELGT